MKHVQVIQNIMKHWFICHETCAKYCTKKFVYKNVCYVKKTINLYVMKRVQVIQNIVKHWFICHETCAKYFTKKYVYKNMK